MTFIKITTTENGEEYIAIDKITKMFITEFGETRIQAGDFRVTTLESAESLLKRIEDLTAPAVISIQHVPEFFSNELVALQCKVEATQAGVVKGTTTSETLCQALIDAVEGECHGLSIDESQAQRILDYLAAQQPIPEASQAHQWDDVGERCTVCGDKDWMAGPVCAGKSAPQPAQETPQAESGWRPIETAPKDGRRVLAIQPGMTTPSIAYCAGPGRSRDGGDYWIWVEPVHFGRPTHWAPLLDATATQKG